MKIGDILRFGIYDSKIQYPNSKVSRKRTPNCFEFDYIISCDKDATSFINGNSHKLFPQIMIVRKPEQECYSRLHFKCYCLHLKLEKTSALYDELGELPDFYALINGNDYRDVLESFIRHNMTDGSNLGDCYSAAKLLELFYMLERDAPQNKFPQRVSVRKENLSIQKAVDFMKNHFDQPVSLGTLGELTGYSPNHFQKLFTEIMRTSPQKHLENLRISHAKYLLATLDASIAEVAYSCGFSSQAYFTSIFKRLTGLTPYEFRKSCIVKNFI